MPVGESCPATNRGTGRTATTAVLAIEPLFARAERCLAAIPTVIGSPVVVG
jgi:hypothetical protein